MPRKRITKLILDHVAHVDVGANQHAHAKLWKRLAPVRLGPGADAMAEAGDEMRAREAMSAMMNAFYDMQEQLRCALMSIMGDDTIDDKKGAVVEAIQVAMDKLKSTDVPVTKAEAPEGAGSPPSPPTIGAAGDGSDEEAGMADKDTNQGAGTAGRQPGTANPPQPQQQPGTANPNPQGGNANPGTQRPPQPQGGGTREGAQAEGQAVDEAADAPVTLTKRELDALLALPSVVQSLAKKLGDMEAETVELRKARHQAVDAQYVTKARQMFPNLAGDVTAVGVMLRGIEERQASADPAIKAQAERELEILKASDAAMRGHFQGVGKSGVSLSVGDTALAINKAAQEIARRDGISIGEATRKTDIERPELWAEHFRVTNGAQGGQA